MSGQKPLQVIKGFSSSHYSAAATLKVIKGNRSPSIFRSCLFCCSAWNLLASALAGGCPLVMRCWIKIISFRRHSALVALTLFSTQRQQINIHFTKWQLHTMLNRLARRWDENCSLLWRYTLGIKQQLYTHTLVYIVVKWHRLKYAELTITSPYLQCTHGYTYISLLLLYFDNEENCFGVTKSVSFSVLWFMDVFSRWTNIQNMWIMSVCSDLSNDRQKKCYFRRRSQQLEF